MFRKYTVLMLITSVVAVYSANSLDAKIKNFRLEKCDSKANYPVQFENVTVQIGTNPKVSVSGTFTTEINLDSPIKAVVEVERKVVFWIKLPCEHNYGSCTYEDVCTFGVPADKSCPDVFSVNKVPCRCPIPKGKYVLPDTTLIAIADGQAPFIDGSYRGSVNLIMDSQLLACYNFYLDVVDQDEIITLNVI